MRSLFCTAFVLVLAAGAAAMPAAAETTPLTHLDCRYDESIRDMVCPEIPAGRASAVPLAPAPAAARAPAAPAAPATPATAAATAPGNPAQGSAEWNAACAAKYKSFNPETGMYKSFSGQMRPCK